MPFMQTDNMARPDSGRAPMPVYLSLGTNLGDREANLRDAIARVGALGGGLRVSSIYETEPVEYTDQPWFLNCVAEFRTALPPAELIEALLEIERQMGRDRRGSPAKGPRLIDIDVLLYGSEIIDLPGLTVPHPAMAARRFVLAPLAELAPEVLHPVLGKNARELLGALEEGGPRVRRLL